MKKKNAKRIIAIVILGLVIISLGLASCADVFRNHDDPVSNNGNCPVEPASEYQSFSFARPHPKLYIIFIDRSLRFKDFYMESLESINDSLKKVLNPGDRVILAWMDYNNFDSQEIRIPLNAIFWDEMIGKVPPPALPTPINTPMLEPTVTLGPGDVGRNISRATSEAIIEQNKTPVASYHCRIGQSNLEAKYSYSMWQKEEMKKKGEFMNDLVEEMKAIEVLAGTPYKFVYDSLSLASKIVGDEIKNGNGEKEYVLIFFSDMFEWRGDRDKPENYDISKLKNVDVIIAMPNCKFISLQKDCTEAQDRWGAELFNHSKSLKFLSNIKSNPDQLSEYIFNISQP